MKFLFWTLLVTITTIVFWIVLVCGYSIVVLEWTNPFTVLFLTNSDGITARALFLFLLTGISWTAISTANDY